MVTLEEVRNTINELDKYLNSGELKEKDLTELLNMLVELNSIKRDIASVYGQFSSQVTRRMEAENLSEISIGGADIKYRAAYSRKKWDNTKLFSDTYDRLSQLATDIDTGEIELSPKEIAANMLQYVNPSYWRVKELSKLGINADNYCEVEEKSAQIAIYRSNNSEDFEDEDVF